MKKEQGLGKVEGRGYKISLVSLDRFVSTCNLKQILGAQNNKYFPTERLSKLVRNSSNLATSSFLMT